MRLARRINRLLGRTGSLFASRYHARALRTPRELRNALRCVLLNARHHAAEHGRRLARDWLDPCSSAPWFDGFRIDPRERGPARAAPDWLAFLQRQVRPTATARTWLLATGWRRHGLLIPTEVPGSSRSQVVGRRSSVTRPAARHGLGVRGSFTA